MYTIEKLIIYPIKGLPAIEVAEAFAERKGFIHDRRWMLVDQSGMFLSQRSHPELTQIRQSLEGGKLILHYQDQSISLEVEEKTEREMMVTLWNHTIKAKIADLDISDFFSGILGQKVFLVTMDKDHPRIKDLLNASLSSTAVSFADGYPYLFLGSASVDLLNEKLAAPLSYDRFRPNIYVRTAVAHVEDQWSIVSGENTIFQIVKPCVRCAVISIDQQTGEQGKEPLKTLASYRKAGNGVIFGANSIVLQEGMVRLGEKLMVDDH